MITFGDLQNGAVGRSSGLDVTGPDFLKYANEAVRMLINRGSWWASVFPMYGCARDNIVVWPRGVGTILAMNVCGRQVILDNRWYQFMQPDTRHRQWAHDFNRRGWGGQMHAELVGNSPVFNPIKAEGFTIRTFITKPSDAGKAMTWYGTDVNGQPIITTQPDGTIQDGATVILANPSVDTTVAIRHVTRVVKPQTDGDVLAYQYNVAGGFMLDLARYQPTETSPDYIVSELRSHHCQSNCSKVIEALVKVHFVPFRYPNDMVQIENEDAIRDMLLAIRKKEAMDMAGSIALETSAIRELNYQMKQRFPDEQFIVNFRPFGRDDLNNADVRIGQL